MESNSAVMVSWFKAEGRMTNGKNMLLNEAELWQEHKAAYRQGRVPSRPLEKIHQSCVHLIGKQENIQKWERHGIKKW